MWMFSHSHTLKSQKYAHARDWTPCAHTHMAPLTVCVHRGSLPTLAFREKTRTHDVSSKTHTHTHTHTHTRREAERTSLIAFVRREGRSGQNVNLFLIFVFYHSHSFRYSQWWLQLFKLTSSAVQHMGEKKTGTLKRKKDWVGVRENDCGNAKIN